MSIRIINADVMDGLASLADESVHMVCTSPPYWGLRQYIADHAPEKQHEIGLEPTLQEHIAKLVEVFREVRRVLRKDGTLWLNYGDAYASGSAKSHGGFDGKNKNQDGTPRTSRMAGQRWGGPSATGGCKPKDLMLMPERLAIALQEPYYTGRIKSEADRIWLAAMIDAEGCMFIHKRKAGDGNHSAYTKKDGTVSRYSRTQDTYSSGLEVANTSRAIVERCLAITGQGSICEQTPDQNNRRKQTIHRWNLRSNECREVIREIYPHFVAKRQQARILIGCPSAGDLAAASHQAMIDLHNGVATDVDFPEPESMFEPGWYIRARIVWQKPNPMPESVTDRPTKSHEHIWLMSKAPRYFYDAEAIREEATGDGQRSGRFIKGNADRAPDKRTDVPPAGYRHLDDARNARDVWTIATAPFPEAHFATFPPELAERCIKAGCPSGGTVLDPFGGSGTTGLVADRLQRNAILIELNSEYAEMAKRRVREDAGMFTEIVA